MLCAALLEQTTYSQNSTHFVPPAESEVQKAEDAMKQSNRQVRRTQEDKERARKIDGIIHNVVQSVSISSFYMADLRSIFALNCLSCCNFLQTLCSTPVHCLPYYCARAEKV